MDTGTSSRALDACQVPGHGTMIVVDTYFDLDFDGQRRRRAAAGGTQRWPQKSGCVKRAACLWHDVCSDAKLSVCLLERWNGRLTLRFTRQLIFTFNTQFETARAGESLNDATMLQERRTQRSKPLRGGACVHRIISSTGLWSWGRIFT